MAGLTDADWEEWFDNQWDLQQRIDKAVEGLAKSYSEDARGAYRLALWSSVIEHASEALRNEIPTVTSSGEPV